MNDMVFDPSDLLQLSADEPGFTPADEAEIRYWKFLIVDDDRDIHRVTRLVLGDHTFEGRKLYFLSAYSGTEAMTMLNDHPDTAVVMLDVVMEQEDSGLRLVRYVREELDNQQVRIILRTGQPGQAPEHAVIRAYDISDYKEKTELTSQKLFSTVYTSIRTYRYISRIAADNETLEQLVCHRTQELEQRARQLQASMRQAYEAMTEISLLEERSRIARDIHNVVGHTLTAAVVQLEAGKCLIDIDTSRASDKLELAQQLVRKGLDEIRGAVHQLAEKKDTIELRKDLERLVQETENHIGVRIHCKIDPLPELTFYQSKLIYHALQEGLTNGIRHGRSTSFRFRLTVRERHIVFSLRNNGVVQPDVQLGFGLSALREQAELAHGVLSLQAAPDEGMELCFRFPITVESAFASSADRRGEA
ncbi:ATP-binding response regulator [Paenibacillus tyrfis]|uniref:ATP-binding response regulator n=1 Tax=Paenibacillus tyrfis TaxID=1501230 RepID=UPI0015C5F743|nr:histidine kinase [Paenibacillus tyrfis]